MKKSFLLAGLVLSVLTFAFGTNHGFNDLFGPLFHPAPGIPHPGGPRRGLDSLHRWNVIAINASGLDHTPVAPGENRVFGEQLGPGRSSRAMAIVHIAMFDALDAVVGGYTSYTGTQAPHGPMSVDAAISQAARDTLAAMFPSQTATFDAYLAEDLAAVPNAHQRANGIDLGQRTATAILAMRLNDGSQIPEPRVGVDYFPSDQPGHWRQDPISLIPLALGAHWGECIPFVVNSTSAIPRAASARYDQRGLHCRVQRSEKSGWRHGDAAHGRANIHRHFLGLRWHPKPVRASEALQSDHGADCRPKQIEQHSIRAVARLGKRRHGRCRYDDLGIEIPLRFLASVTGIRESDPGTGPTGLGDGNPDTVGDPSFSPLGAPASNLTGAEFYAAVPRVSVRSCRIRRGALRSDAPLLWHR